MIFHHVIDCDNFAFSGQYLNIELLPILCMWAAPNHYLSATYAMHSIRVRNLTIENRDLKVDLDSSSHQCVALTHENLVSLDHNMRIETQLQETKLLLREAEAEITSLKSQLAIKEGEAYITDFCNKLIETELCDLCALLPNPSAYNYRLYQKSFN